MELMLLVFLPALLLACLVPVAVGTAVVTWLYVRTCYDRSEEDGRRYWPRVRRACCCIPCLRRLYNYQVLAMLCKAPR